MSTSFLSSLPVVSSSRRVKVRITNASGHTELEQDLGAAIETVLKAHFGNRQWAYVGARSFQFQATSTDDPALLQDAIRLKEMIEESDENIVVTLAGDLVGGATTFKLRITDASGHTETIEELAAGIAKVIAQHSTNKKWAFIGSQNFQFDEEALRTADGLVAETQRLFAAVSAAAEDGTEVVVTLTGDLVGGR